MKKQLLTALCLIASMAATAAPVGKERVRQQAATFLLQKNGTRHLPGQNASLRLTEPLEMADGALYVFNISDERGYIVASGDDRTPAILGYADQGNISPDDMPQNMRAWLQSYADQLQQPSTEQAPVSIVSGSAISPLINTTWDQDSPYNLLCPVMPETNTHAYTGCVATAMAQVMNFHKWPHETTTPIPAYESYQNAWGYSDYNSYWADYDIYNYIWVDEIGITTIDWENMLSSYSSQATEDEQLAVARLMQLCGASVRMQYNDVGSSLSGNVYAVDALVNYFDYDRSVHNEPRTAHKAAQWNQLIYDELAAGRPVLYNGQSTGGGHAFVVDGYDENNYFHVNWGWSGSANGYFLLAALDPSTNSGSGASNTTDGYNYWQGAVIGIRPQQGTPAPAPLLTSTILKVWNDGHEFDLVNDDRFGLTFNYSNNTGVDGTWQIALAFLDEEGTIVSHHDLFQKEMANGEEESIKGYFYWQDFTTAAGYDASAGYRLPLPDGIYHFVVCSQLTDGNGENVLSVNYGMDEHYATVVIDNGKLTMTWPEEPVIVLNMKGTAACVEEPEIYVPTTVRFTLTNEGTDFNQDVFFLANGVQQAGNVLEAAAGETAIIDFCFTPQTLGDVAVSLVLADGTELASETICVTTPEASLNITAEVKNQQENVVTRKNAFVKLTIGNEGQKTYTKDVIAALYKEADDGQFYYVDEQGQTVNIGAGQTGTADVTFSDVENGATYLVNMFYLTPDGYTRSGNYTWFSVEFQEADLAIDPVVDNAVRYLDDWTAVVSESTAVLKNTVTNNGSSDYKSAIVARYYKLNDEGTEGFYAGEVEQETSIAAGATATVNLELTELEDGATYFAYLYYISNGEEVQGYAYNPFFTIDLQTTVGSPKADDSRHNKTIFRLDGRRMSAGSLSSLRRGGIYIVDGKKVATYSTSR